jgi:hypothetical protein
MGRIVGTAVNFSVAQVQRFSPASGTSPLPSIPLLSLSPPWADPAVPRLLGRIDWGFSTLPFFRSLLAHLPRNRQISTP